MMQRQAKAPGVAGAMGRFVVRLAVILALALGIGTTLNFLSGRLSAPSEPAGFGRGMFQGALMPLALPNLLVGRDVPIYAVHNTGRLYKLGYTVGVNGCGALFFGLLFWRFSRLRRRLAQRASAVEA